MGRENGGVKRIVTENAGHGSIGRGESQAGKMGEEGGLKPVGAEMNSSIVSNDMSAITGSKGSSGTVKGNGGVGDVMGGEEHRNFFEDKH